jgi:hypothetical protein
VHRTCMNTACKYHSDFFGVASSRTGSRFDTVEVRSSSLLVPTIYLIESAHSRAAQLSGKALLSGMSRLRSRSVYFPELEIDEWILERLSMPDSR